MTRLTKSTGTLGALNAVSGTIESRAADISVANTGSFSGTITVYRNIAGTDVVVDTFTSSEMPYDQVIENATPRAVYLKVTSYVSGSCTYYLAGE